MDDKLFNYLASLPRANLINLMFMALDEMQHCNSWSRERAIMHAIEAEEVRDGAWKLPSLTKVKELTSQMVL